MALKIGMVNAPKDGLLKSEIKSRNLVWLQGLGWCEGKPLSEFVVGETMVWNDGGTSTVVELTRSKGGSVTGVVEESKGTRYTRTRRGSTLTVFAVES